MTIAKALYDTWISVIHNNRAAESIIEGVLLKELERLYPGKEYLRIGSWECENSPIGVCIYDEEDDLACDSCLICGDPHERM